MPQRMPELARGPHETTTARRARILLVSGEIDTRALLAQALVEEGLTVDEANDAHDALAIVDYAPPDVVVYMLGWGAGLHQLDEIEATVEDHGACPPAVVLTTPTWMRAKRGITLRGPVRIHELVAAIGRALREHRRDLRTWTAHR